MLLQLSSFGKSVALVLLFILLPVVAHAGDDDRFKGWAWSSNIGWISFNCTNTNSCGSVDYGVTIAANNTDVTGWAWSSNIGWIDFSGTTFNSVTGRISGSASAIAGTVETDGWDGRIELYDTSPIAYGLDVQIDSEVAGYAWGDDVVGWVSFNCENDSSCGTVDYQVIVEPFFFNFTASIGTDPANRVPYDGSTTLNWTTIGAASCTASGAPATGWAAPPAKPAGEPSSGQETILNLVSDTTFVLTCRDSANRTITRTLPIYVNPPAPALVMTVDDDNIPINTGTNVNWDAEFVQYCNKSGQWGTGSSTIGVGQTEATGNLSNLENFFNLTCYSNNPGIYPNPVFAQVLVNVERLTLDFGLQSGNIPFSDPTVLEWTATFATSDQCTASGGAGTTWTSPAIKAAVTDVSYSETIYQAGTLEPLDTGDYTFILTCAGSAGQPDIVRQATLKVGRNPNFSEEIGTNPDN